MKIVVGFVPFFVFPIVYNTCVFFRDQVFLKIFSLHFC